MITLTSHADARDAFRSRELRQALYDAGERLMHGVIVNLHGEEHLARRRLENRLFRRDTFAWYEHDRIPRIVATILHDPVATGGGDLLVLARRTMMTLSMEVAGVDLPLGTAAFDRLAALMDDLARASTVAHAVGDTTEIIATGDRALAAFEREFFEPSLRRRATLVSRFDRGEIDESELPRDVLTTLLRNQDRLDLDDGTVLREVAYFPWVGSHSTSHQLVHAMHHMFEWIAVHPSTRELLEQDDLLRQRFVHESMRLHPASPVALRTALADVTLRSGMVLPAGERIAISVHDANRDPSVFPDEPDRFDPYRRVRDGVAPWGLSFGHGPHACLGQELAGGIEPDDLLERHLLGSVALMAGAMLRAGARPDPDDAAVLDASTTRSVWARYPVRFAHAARPLPPPRRRTGNVHAVSNEQASRALQLLKDAGLSGYEAKAYLALLAAGEPLNGYEVAKASGVPRSTVYETLGKLVSRGAAFEVNDASDSVSYVPLPSDALISRLRRQTHETIAGLETALPSIGAALAARVVQHLTGRADVVSRAIDVIESARRSLWLSIWPQEGSELVVAVDAAVERGVEVFTIAYGDLSALPGRVYAHSYSSPDVVEQRLQCRLSIVVADHEQAMIGGVTSDAVWGMWSDDRAVALLAAEHVRHDIALQLTAEHLEAAGLHDFWAHNPDLEALRDASAAAIGANAPDR